eukprot:1881857-Ditylum_brightwellii.AAC.2
MVLDGAVLVGLRVRVSYSDIDDAVCLALPQTSDGYGVSLHTDTLRSQAWVTHMIFLPKNVFPFKFKNLI